MIATENRIKYTNRPIPGFVCVLLINRRAEIPTSFVRLSWVFVPNTIFSVQFMV